MEEQRIRVSSIVRHKAVMQGINLAVVKIKGDKIVVRYAAQGIFQTQKLYLNEVDLHEEKIDEYL